MNIGIPREIKENEFRVAAAPSGVMELKKAGHAVFVQKGAGEGSCFPDQDYMNAGAKVLDKAEDVYAGSDIIVKVKEPLPEEFRYFRPGLIIFTFLHLASHPELAKELMKKGVTAVGYETIETPDKTLPILKPMSEIAGRLAPQIAAHHLLRPYGGRGVLLSGVQGVLQGRVLILGMGTVGISAAIISIGLGADVTIVDASEERLSYARGFFKGSINTCISEPSSIGRSVAQSDLVIGAVHIPGARTPVLIPRHMLKTMKKGSVIVDVSVDQGGCVETIRPTTHSEPVYEVDGIIHYGVANMPGAVPWTATRALTNATLPYVLKIANLGLKKAVIEDPSIEKGINIQEGGIIHQKVKEALKI